ncbi:hypothetical protein [Streptomyces sp. NPDC059874]|uniref:hypothetical protein n=1 Tax=Streptomyces sp. NPDC059874 TaxID=3346983 RepID=UPI00365FCC5B
MWKPEFTGPEGWGIHQWFGYRSTADLRRRFAENGLLDPDGGQWHDLMIYSILRAERTGGTAK